jgi:Chaperone of endosialidase
MTTSIWSLATVTFTVIAFALSPVTQAVSPPPDGGYPGDNTAEGQNALSNLATGTYNTAVGFFSLTSNVQGNFNSAIGAGALLSNTGSENTATGAAALLSNTVGTGNTASGVAALGFNTSGSSNTATGLDALVSNTSGSSNTASGVAALSQNTVGSANTATGINALLNNTEGAYNTANGAGALAFNTIADDNTAIGAFALEFNTEGYSNTAIGSGALSHNTTGFNNTAIGEGALSKNSTGFGNTALGVTAGLSVTTANDVICIGSGGADVSGTTWIGNIYGVTTQSGTTAPVIISDGGQLGTVASSERFKKDIATMDTTSEAILSLRPVRFHYKNDTKGTPQFGLIAEEVAKVNPALVLPDKEGKPYTVRYDAVNVMLLNEFLKEHRRVEELKSAMAQQRTDFEAAMAQQQKRMEAVVARLTEQEARIQKVSAQIEMGKPPSQTLVQNH